MLQFNELIHDFSVQLRNSFDTVSNNRIHRFQGVLGVFDQILYPLLYPGSLSTEQQEFSCLTYTEDLNSLIDFDNTQVARLTVSNFSIQIIQDSILDQKQTVHSVDEMSKVIAQLADRDYSVCQKQIFFDNTIVV